MGLCGVIFPGVIDCVSFGLVSTVGLVVLGEIFLAPMIYLAPEVAPQVMLTSWALMVILACAVAVDPLLNSVITQVVRLLDWTREELDAGRTDWTGHREADVEPKDVDIDSTIDPQYNHSSVHRASETKLCRSHILGLSTAPTTAILYHDLDRSTIRVTYDSTPVKPPKAHISKKRSSSGLMDPTEDLYVSKDTCETPVYPEFDYNPFKDEDNPLATEQETVELQIPAQEVKCKEPREVTHPSHALTYCAIIRTFVQHADIIKADSMFLIQQMALRDPKTCLPRVDGGQLHQSPRSSR